MSKHTQGEWKVSTEINEYDGRPHVYTSDLQTLIAIVSGWTEDDEKANAKLIAAAPDLLEALQMLLREYEDVKMNTPIAFFKVINAAESAIKKATN